MSAADLGPNLVALFERMARSRRAAVPLAPKRDGIYRPWSWRRVAEEVRFPPGRMRAQGLARGDRAAGLQTARNG